MARSWNDFGYAGIPARTTRKSLTDVRLSSAGMLPLPKKIVLPSKTCSASPIWYLAEDGANANVASSQTCYFFGVIHEAKNDNYNQ